MLFTNGWPFVAAAIFRKRKKRYLYPSNRDVAHVIAAWLDQPVAIIATAEMRNIGEGQTNAVLKDRVIIAIITQGQKKA